VSTGGRWTDGRLYYGWVLVLALGVTETVSYGILQYAFPVFIVPMRAELGWSTTEITGAFSLAVLVSGVAAVPVGGWVDRHGARGLMTAGSLLAVLTLAAWSRVEGLAAFYALSAAMGVAMAAVLYEPAFALVAGWFSRHRGRALTVLTFMGGFASVVFVPLAAWLVEVRRMEGRAPLAGAPPGRAHHPAARAAAAPPPRGPRAASRTGPRPPADDAARGGRRDGRRDRAHRVVPVAGGRSRSPRSPARRWRCTWSRCCWSAAAPPPSRARRWAWWG
jgi:MFS family permease